MIGDRYTANGHDDMYVVGYAVATEGRRVTPIYYLCCFRTPGDAPIPDPNPLLNMIHATYTAEKSRFDGQETKVRGVIAAAQMKIQQHLYDSGWDGVDPISEVQIPENLQADWNQVKEYQTYFDQVRWARIHADIADDW